MFCINNFSCKLFKGLNRMITRLIKMKIRVVFGLLTSVLVLSNCMTSPKKTWVTEIKDMRGEHPMSWQMQYDVQGRLSEYGHTPISYAVNEIRIGETNWTHQKERLLSATFSYSQGKVSHSEARCLWIEDSSETEVIKVVDYTYAGDTVRMKAHYQTLPDNRFFRKVSAEYIYDPEGNLSEIISRYTDMNEEESACHSYYTYVGNIDYEANLNLQSFFTDVEGADAFYFFLLNMNGSAYGKKLPTHIRYCVNHGTATYTADGLYQLTEDFLKYGETISYDRKVKARLEFSYYPEDY